MDIRLSFLVLQEFIMTKYRNFHYPLFLICTSLWWGWTVLVDMFVVRTIFSTIDDFFAAGDLGMSIFTQLNNLELVIGSVMIVVLVFESKSNNKILDFFILSLICWMMIIFYFSYLTPKLIELSTLWKQSHLLGISNAGSIKDIQQEHQFYHRLYMKLDSLKLFILTVLLFLSIWKQEKWK
jgi:hypothetical protein